MTWATQASLCTLKLHQSVHWAGSQEAYPSQYLRHRNWMPCGAAQAGSLAAEGSWQVKLLRANLACHLVQA